MKKIKIFFILALVGILLAGCKGKEARVQKQLDLGSKYMAELDYESAIVALNKAIKIDPKNVDAYTMLAEVYEKSGRLDEARTTLEKVLDIGELSSKDKDEINSRIKNLEFLVTISKASGEYDEPMALELSNASKYDIHYSIETENNRLVATDMKYTSPLLLDEDGSYIVKAYTVDSHGETHGKTEVKYTIKLGHLDKNSWENIGNIYRYRGEDGKIVTGWVKIDESWYYFKDNGDMATGVEEIKGVKYYFGEDGVMLTGWQQRDGKWYYILDSGECSTGWKEIDGKWYHFADNGEMETNRHIDGYYVGADGVRMDVKIDPVPPSKKYTDQFVYTNKYKTTDSDGEQWSDVSGFVYNDMRVMSIQSEGPIIDRGSYYEVQNAVFLGWTHIADDAGDYHEMFKTTVYVRKNAIGTLWDHNRTTEKTAEQCFKDNGGRLWDIREWTEVLDLDRASIPKIVLFTDIEELDQCIDKDGYLKKFDDLWMHSN